MAELDRDMYPPVGFYFKVTFEGVGDSKVDSRFQEVTGFENKIDTEDLNEGGENRFAHKLPKKVKYNNLVLKRGLMMNSKLITWITDAVDEFIFNPVSLSVSLLNENGDPLVSWDFYMAYPVKWSTSDLKAQENAIVVETLELAYQHFKKSYHKY